MRILASPVFAYWELTPSCNNRCPGCGNVFSHSGIAPLSAVEWMEILRRLRPGLQRLRLTGGEPTLHPEFPTIVRQIQETHLPFAVFTNGRWENPTDIVTLLQVTPMLTGLLISLHGPDPTSHDAFTRVSGSFEETVDNIRRAVSAGLPVSTSTVITTHNYNRIPEILEQARDLKVAYSVFSRYVTSPNTVMQPDEDQLQEAIRHVETARQEGASVRFSVCIPQCFARSSSTGCLAGIAYLTIDPWGNVRPCNHAPLTCGNLLEEPLATIWRSEELQRWRAMIPSTCTSCQRISSCRGGCRAAMMLHKEEQDPLMKEPIRTQSQSEPLHLPAQARPIFDGWMRRESFGYILIRGNRLTPVSAAAKNVLDLCDGQRTLSDIQAQQGHRAIRLIGALWQRGIIDWNTTT